MVYGWHWYWQKVYRCVCIPLLEDFRDANSLNGHETGHNMPSFREVINDNQNSCENLELQCYNGVTITLSIKYKASINRRIYLLGFCFILLSKSINVYGIRTILFYWEIKPDGKASGSKGRWNSEKTEQAVLDTYHVCVGVWAHCRSDFHLLLFV